MQGREEAGNRGREEREEDVLTEVKLLGDLSFCLLLLHRLWKGKGVVP